MNRHGYEALKLQRRL